MCGCALLMSALALLPAADPTPSPVASPAQPVEVVIRVKIEPGGTKAEVVGPGVESDPVRKYKQRLNDLGDAAEAGRISLMVEFFKAGADANDKDDHGRTPLHRAAAKGNKTGCLTLLAYGADVCEQDADGVTPLMLAAEAGHTAIVELLLSGYTVNEVMPSSLKATVGDEEKFRARLERQFGRGRAAEDKLGQTAVHKAAAAGQRECLALLVDSSGSSGQMNADKAGRTPLHLAAAAGKAAAFDLPEGYEPLLASTLGVKTADGKTALDLARSGKHAATVAKLEALAVLAAAAAGDVASVEAARKADPARFPANKVFLLACVNKQLAVLKAVQGLYADKPTKDKVALFDMPYGYYLGRADYAALRTDWVEGTQALFDRKWWNDDPALAVWLAEVLGNVSSTDKTESVAFIRKLLVELKPRK